MMEFARKKGVLQSLLNTLKAFNQPRACAKLLIFKALNNSESILPPRTCASSPLI